jgi:N-acetylglucosamine kinase-like BadF-type ATPase
VSPARPPEVAVLAVDGGNSKTDLLLVAPDGRLLASGRGPTSSHQKVGMDAGAERLVEQADGAWARAGLGAAAERPAAAVGSYALAGADTPADVRRLRGAFEIRRLASATLIVNDSIAPIRAGSERGWGVGLICGAGVNAAGIGPDGRIARLAALGPISGDWGGGGALGMAALGAAVRARDGRGPRTVLERMVPAFFDMHRPIDVTHAIEYGRLPETALYGLSPTVFAAARDGDAVAQGILDRLADELATMATAIIRRLHLARRDPVVVLAGGVFRARDASLEARIAAGIQAVAPAATIRRLDAPPVLGAALLGLDRLPGRSPSGRAAAERRLRADVAASTLGGA